MRRFNLALAAFSFLALSPLANADLLYTDWKAGGDQKALLDTQTGIEWLRLTNTVGMSFHQVKNLLATQFSGWRFPTAAEVETMMDNHYPYPLYAGQTVLTWDLNIPLIRQWVDLFGVTNSNNQPSSTLVQSYGLYYANPAFGQIQMAGGYHRDSWNAQNVHNYTSTLYEDVPSGSYWEGFTSPTTGIFLVSDGGTTLSSLLNPMQNAMNPNAPVNQTPPPSEVPVMGGFGLLLAGLFARRTYRR